MDQKDLKQISDLLDSKFAAYDGKMDDRFAAYDRKMDDRFVAYDRKLDSKFVVQDKKINIDIDTKLDKRIGELEQKMFEWKSEIVDIVDGLAKEIRDQREFRDISSHQTSGNTRRIERLERKVFGVAESGV